MKQKFDIWKNPKTFAYVLERDTFTHKCNRCGCPVLRSDTDGYEYQCMNCDEDLYEIETHEGNFHTDEELDWLCCATRDLLLKDETEVM